MLETNLLEELGFSQNEAKCFIALTKKSPMTGYEVAKSSGITRTMVYDVLGRLERKNYVKVIEGNPKMYYAVKYTEFIKDARNEFEEKLNAIEKQLESLTHSENKKNYVFNLSGKSEMIATLKKAIDESRETVYLSAWSEELLLIADNLRAANERGVKIYIFSFCEIPFSFGIQYSYNLENAQLRFPNRRITGVFDREKIIMGEGNEKYEEISILSENPMLIEMAIDQILIDIILHRTLNHYGYLCNDKSIERYSQGVADFLEAIEMYPDIPKRIYE